MLQICRMESVAVAYHCDCGQRLVLTNFDPSLLERETEGLDLLVLRVSDQAACPECGAPFAPVWQAAERVLVKDMLARLESMGIDGLVHALQLELRDMQEARLRCN
jgi:hypothetical protein